MEQLKTAFAVVKKYYFWILSGFIVVLYLGTWFMATSSMTKATETRVSKITQAYSKGTSVASVSNHPNTESVKMMKDLNRAEAMQVGQAWETRYREQEDVLVWPTLLLPDFICHRRAAETNRIGRQVPDTRGGRVEGGVP